MNNPLTILATTYAINPYKGSEDGMGWGFVCQIARFNKVIAITRENNQAHIEKFMLENPNEIYNHIRFLYFDLPKWQRSWKKGSRGAMIYYWMWQIKIVSFIKRENIQFDIAHNLNFHNDWTPSYLWKLKKPFVWGPIGHHPLIPGQYLRPYKSIYKIKDRLIWLVKKMFWNLSPSLKRTINKADFIYLMNSSVLNVLNLKGKNYQIYPSVATDDFGIKKLKKNDRFRIISAGRLVPLKGFDLSILSFAAFLKKLAPADRDKCELIIVGSGPESGLYKELVRVHEVQKYVKFIQWMDREDLLGLMAEVSMFLFPSHEGAGMVIPEALSFGLPVVCLDNYGPGEFIDPTCAFAIPHQDYSGTVKNLSNAIGRLYHDIDLRIEMSKNSRLKFIEKFDWNRRGEFLNLVYSKL